MNKPLRPFPLFSVLGILLLFGGFYFYFSTQNWQQGAVDMEADLLVTEPIEAEEVLGPVADESKEDLVHAPASLSSTAPKSEIRKLVEAARDLTPSMKNFEQLQGKFSGSLHRHNRLDTIELQIEELDYNLLLTDSAGGGTESHHTLRGMDDKLVLNANEKGVLLLNLEAYPVLTGEYYEDEVLVGRVELQKQ